VAPFRRTVTIFISQEDAMSGSTRAFEMALDIEAAPDDVWTALTEAGELVRWFPLSASVTPGAGGAMRWAWDEAWPWTFRVDAWEPGRRLRLLHEGYRPFDAAGQPVGDAPAAGPVAVEFTLEAGGGGTRLRLVHSGFGRGAEWDDEFDGISHGWPFELCSLRHYLRHHRGRDRQFVWARATTALEPAAAWARLTSAEGFALSPARPQPGAPCEVRAASGERFSGTAELFAPPHEMAGTVSALDDGIFRLATYRAAGKSGITVWLATWGGVNAVVSGFATNAQQVLDRLFAGA
jgi:uncharacterized protein YndB with AHSA1/START domain